MLWLAVLYSLLPAGSAHAGPAPFSAFEFFQATSPLRPRPSGWPAGLHLTPARVAFDEMQTRLQANSWRVLFHCSGSPASAALVERLYHFDQAGHLTLTYAFGLSWYERVEAEDSRRLRVDSGILDLSGWHDGTYYLSLTNVANPQSLSFRPVLIEETGEIGLEGLPGRKDPDRCEDGTPIRNIWVPLEPTIS